jgi:L-threonylcarbamoyladenylate synthase
MKSIRYLAQQKTILYPTDTVWGLGCDATSEHAVSAIYKIKQRAESKRLIILVDSVSMLRHYVEKVPVRALEVIENATKPTTLIYKQPKNLAQNAVAQGDTVAIRVVSEGYCHQLIRAFGKPIVSTSANISGQPTPSSFKEIEPSILACVDYVVDLHRDDLNEKSSTILKVEDDGQITVIRP